MTGPSACELPLLPCGLYDARKIRIQALAKRYAAERDPDVAHIWSDHASGPYYIDDDKLRAEYPDASRADIALFSKSFTEAYRRRLLECARSCMEPAQVDLLARCFGSPL